MRVVLILALILLRTEDPILPNDSGSDGEGRNREESDNSSDSSESLLTETDDSDIDSDIDSDDDFEVPRDLQHERRMAALRKENARLEQICREQNYELYAMSNRH